MSNLNRRVYNLKSYSFFEVSRLTVFNTKRSFYKNRQNIYIENYSSGGNGDEFPVLPAYSFRINGLPEFVTYSRFYAGGTSYYLACRNPEDLGIVLLYLKKYFKNKRKIVPKTKTEDRYKFIKDLYINESTKHEIIKAVKPYIEIAINYGSILSKSCAIIFEGIPGTSKSYNAASVTHGIAKLTGYKYIPTTAEEFAAKADDISNYCILIDDANQSHFARNLITGQICANLLSKMDAKGCSRFFCITTNNTFNLDEIDRAFFRPGRIEHIIRFQKPDNSVKTKFLVDTFNDIINHNKDVAEPLKANGAMAAIIDKACEREDFTFANLVEYRNKILTNLVYGSIGNINVIANESCDNVPSNSVEEISLP